VREGLIHKAGSWYSYQNDKIGQGKENVKVYLNENPEIAETIEKLLREKLMKPAGKAPVEEDSKDQPSE